MAMLGTKLRTIEGGRLGFWCPGCEMLHQIRVEGGRPGPLWGWDGSADAPTFQPSIKVEWRWWDGEKHTDKVCHTFVTAGVIDFLGDCTHKLAGQKVPLPDLPDDWWEKKGD